MAVQPAIYKQNKYGALTARNPSPAIWADCPVAALREGSIDGFYFEDDFTSFGLPGTQTTEIQNGLYKLFCSTAGVWQTDAMPHSATPAGVGGIISALCDTAGDQAVIGTQACPFYLATTQSGKLWFEARVATTSILTNMGQWFVGLLENNIDTYAAAVPLADANATAISVAAIGFNRLEDGLGVLNTSYIDHTNPGAWVDIQAAANSTLAANTWIKLGMKVDFSNAQRCVKFFVDNVECSTAMTRAALLATTHLDAKGLGPCMAFFADSAGTADYVYLDWWRVYQTL